MQEYLKRLTPLSLSGFPVQQALPSIISNRLLGKMRIKKTITGDFNQEWKFPESMNQEKMIAIIEDNIQRRMFK